MIPEFQMNKQTTTATTTTATTTDLHLLRSNNCILIIYQEKTNNSFYHFLKCGACLFCSRWHSTWRPFVAGQWGTDGVRLPPVQRPARPARTVSAVWSLFHAPPKPGNGRISSPLPSNFWLQTSYIHIVSENL